MNWIYSIRHKFIAAIIMTVLLGLILLNNLNESYNMRKLEASFTSIYKDRLLAESYIYHLSENLHRESEMLESALNHNSQFHIKNSLTQLQNNTQHLISDYEKTKLTKTEEEFFMKLKSLITEINGESNLLINNIGNKNHLTKLNEIQLQFNNAQEILSNLSDIQIKEARNINKSSKAVITGSASSSQFEIVLLIVVALIIHVLIFTSKSTKKELTQKYWLN